MAAASFWVSEEDRQSLEGDKGWEREWGEKQQHLGVKRGTVIMIN